MQISQPTAPSHTPIITAPATNPSSQSIQPNAPPTGASSSISTAQSQTPSTNLSTIPPPNKSQIITLPLSISSLLDPTIQLASQQTSSTQQIPTTPPVSPICSRKSRPTSFPFRKYAEIMLENKPYGKKKITYSPNTKKLCKSYISFTDGYEKDCFEYINSINDKIITDQYKTTKFDELYQNIDNKDTKKFVKDYFSSFYLFLMSLITDCNNEVMKEKISNIEFAENLKKMQTEFNGTHEKIKSILTHIQNKYKNRNDEYVSIFNYLLWRMYELRSITALYEHIKKL